MRVLPFVSVLSSVLFATKTRVYQKEAREENEEAVDKRSKICRTLSCNRDRKQRKAETEKRETEKEEMRLSDEERERLREGERCNSRQNTNELRDRGTLERGHLRHLGFF